MANPLVKGQQQPGRSPTPQMEQHLSTLPNAENSVGNESISSTMLSKLGCSIKNLNFKGQKLTFTKH